MHQINVYDMRNAAISCIETMIISSVDVSFRHWDGNRSTYMRSWKGESAGQAQLWQICIVFPSAIHKWRLLVHLIWSNLLTSFCFSLFLSYAFHTVFASMDLSHWFCRCNFSFIENAEKDTAKSFHLIGFCGQWKTGQSVSITVSASLSTISN